MAAVDFEYIRRDVADTEVIFSRGRRIYEGGAFVCREADLKAGRFSYEVDGAHGDYISEVEIQEEGATYTCDCPYPGTGCKHVVAVMLDALDRLETGSRGPGKMDVEAEGDFLTPDEIREKALEDRRSRARNEGFTVTPGEMLKGDHLLESKDGRQYVVTLHDPDRGLGHCSCPDFNTNGLGTCKHLLFLMDHLHKAGAFSGRNGERFPFVDVYWDAPRGAPRLFSERPEREIADLQPILDAYFDRQGGFVRPDLGEMLHFLSEVDGHKRVCVREEVLRRVDAHLLEREAEERSLEPLPSLTALKAELYPYQEEGVRFALYRKAALIGDEMGLGKTLQGIALALLKKELFGFKRVLVITLASLKEQWRREVERFTDEDAVVVAGSAKARQRIYREDPSLFKITNYEAVLRDGLALSRFKPDLIILDEAQRIKNFSTKTADAVKRLPRKHALVLTGTPLENRLEDVYSIVQFLDPYMLSPLWRFAAEHFLLSRHKKDRIMGYRNLDLLHEKLKDIVMRRRKEEVLSDLPEEIVNNYYIELTEQQAKIHSGYMQSLLPILNKKFLTPMDVRQIQVLLLRMRSVCDSTYLIDRQTNISPKLEELENILDELVVQGRRKAVVFSEWTTMTYLIARRLSRKGVPFVELSGKVPVNKRQALIDEFSNNPECKVFLSTDSGGTGLNLQAADCVINVEPPWNPARLNQRIGRVNRIGQISNKVNVVNLIAKNSIEEKILAGIQLKTELFTGVFDGGVDTVEFSRERRNEMLYQLRKMMGEEVTEDLSDEEAMPGESIPEDTPHFLNPRALAGEEDEDRIPASDEGAGESAPDGAPAEAAWAQEAVEEGGSPWAGQPAEKVEAVLNSGMAFISGLMEMATGRKLGEASDRERMIRLDPETGEVTMKFKLPGF